MGYFHVFFTIILVFIYLLTLSMVFGMKVYHKKRESLVKLKPPNYLKVKILDHFLHFFTEAFFLSLKVVFLNT